MPGTAAMPVTYGTEKVSIRVARLPAIPPRAAASWATRARDSEEHYRGETSQGDGGTTLLDLSGSGGTRLCLILKAALRSAAATISSGWTRTLGRSPSTAARRKRWHSCPPAWPSMPGIPISCRHPSPTSVGQDLLAFSADELTSAPSKYNRHPRRPATAASVRDPTLQVHGRRDFAPAFSIVRARRCEAAYPGVSNSLSSYPAPVVRGSFKLHI